MPLQTLVKQLPNAQVNGPLDRDITGIACDSRRVKKGGLFVALRGEKTDGNNFIEAAINQGAAAIVAEKAEPDSRATTIVVPDSRPALADVAAIFFQNPS